MALLARCTRSRGPGPRRITDAGAHAPLLFSSPLSLSVRGTRGGGCSRRKWSPIRVQVISTWIVVALLVRYARAEHNTQAGPRRITYAGERAPLFSFSRSSCGSGSRTPASLYMRRPHLSPLPEAEGTGEGLGPSTLSAAYPRDGRSLPVSARGGACHVMETLFGCLYLESPPRMFVPTAAASARARDERGRGRRKEWRRAARATARGTSAQSPAYCR